MTTMSPASPQNDAGNPHGPDSPPFRRSSGWFLLRGVLALALAVAAFLFPANALFAFTLLFAAYAGADGILSLVAGIRCAARRQGRWWTLILRGAIGIAVAAIFVIVPGLAIVGYALATLATLVAWALLTSAFEIAAAVRLRREIEGEWRLALSGALSILLGLLVLAILWMDPLASILSVGWIIAGWALFAGAALVALGLRLKRLPEPRSGE